MGWQALIGRAYKPDMVNILVYTSAICKRKPLVGVGFDCRTDFKKCGFYACEVPVNLFVNHKYIASSSKINERNIANSTGF